MDYDIDVRSLQIAGNNAIRKTKVYVFI